MGVWLKHLFCLQCPALSRPTSCGCLLSVSGDMNGDNKEKQTKMEEAAGRGAPSRARRPCRQLFGPRMGKVERQ